MKNKVTIIGFGTMGKAIAKVLSKNDPGIKISWIDKENSSPGASFKNIGKSDFLILAVKPQSATEVIEQFKDYIAPQSILISIMAGVSVARLMRLSGHRKIVRMMPNLGLVVGEGIAPWKKMNLSAGETKKVKSFIDKITANFEVREENTINKITAISGSGPAYFFLLAEALLKAARKLGLKETESLLLVEKTLSAAALLGKGNDYGALMKRIASKGGTTEVALQALREGNLEGIVRKAVEKAYQRAKELGNG